MKSFFKACAKLMLLSCFLFFACENTSTPTEESIPKPAKATDEAEGGKAAVYDSGLAQKYGGDQYGMKRYLLALLKQGDYQPRDSSEAAILQLGHLNEIEKLSMNGDLVLAGPFFDERDELKGLYIFDVETPQEVARLVENDPAIQLGYFEYEIRPWYGSAALVEVNKIHRKIAPKYLTEQ
ncbi:MAG: YciI family protein [Flavobacteriaceae bacterium]|nr:YciI family protein [Flavobacteriaceae bacterium]